MEEPGLLAPLCSTHRAALSPQVWLHEALQLLEQPALRSSQGSASATLQLQASLPAQEHQLLGIIHHRPSAVPHDAARGREEGPVAGLACLL